MEGRTLLKVQCQLCDEYIALTTLEDIRYPIRGEMFKSPDPKHGIPDPFEPGIGWEDMLCPHGRIHRPFIADSLIKTDAGMVRVLQDGTTHIDLSDTGLIDRQHISDRIVMVPEVEAGIRARLELSKEVVHGKAAEGPGKPGDEKPVEGTGEERKAKSKKSVGRASSSV